MSKLLVVFALAVCMSSCVVLSEKEEVTIFGCTDSLALNYIAEATEDDGSCNAITSQRVVFYSSGNWEAGDESAERVLLYNSDGTYYGEIDVNKGVGERDQLLCSDYSADNYKLILEIDRSEAPSFLAVLEYTYYDQFANDFFTTTRDFNFSLENETYNSGCILFNI
mgnify:CR=1 FL=1